MELDGRHAGCGLHQCVHVVEGVQQEVPSLALQITADEEDVDVIAVRLSRLGGRPD